MILSGDPSLYSSTVLLEGNLLHLAYIKYDQELLLMALPENM